MNKQTRYVLATTLLLIPMGLIFFLHKQPVDYPQAKTIAEGAFLSTIKHLKMAPDDFEIVPVAKPSPRVKVIVFTWQQKSRPACRIEVDVDLIYANARPTWNCE